MRVIQGGQEFRFPSQARAPLGIAGERLRQDFYCNVSLQARIAYAVTSPMPPAPIADTTS
jgi:hypothetical protein